MSTDKQNKKQGDSKAEEIAKEVEQACQSIKPQPCWVQAFLIYLLHKHGGKLTLSLADLRRFEALKHEHQTSMSYDEVNKTVTITAPEMTEPDKPRIIHNTGISLN